MEKRFVNIEDEVKNETETYVIVEKFPKINYTLIYRGGEYEPWVAAWGFNGDYWCQGHYFATLENAMEYIRMKMGKPNWYRLDEIASRVIDELIENDPYEAEEYLANEIELTDEEVEYFGVDETLCMVKGYEEDDEDDM